MQLVSCRRGEKRRGQTARNFPMWTLTGSRWQWPLLLAADCADPAKRLWAAVLRDAIDALRGRHAESREKGHRPEATAEVLWSEACRWVMSRAAEPLGTFESVCDALELDTDAVRRDLCAMAAEWRLAPHADSPTMVLVAGGVA